MRSESRALADPRCSVSPTCPPPRPVPGRSWSAWRPPGSTSSTSTTAPASTRTPCRSSRAWRAQASWPPWGRACPSFAKGTVSRGRTCSAPTPSRLLLAADRAVALPAGRCAPRTAAAAMLQGMTAHYLCTSTFPLAKRAHLPRPRGRRRRGAPSGADGEAARRARHRHGGHRGEGRARARGGRRRGDPLPAGGLPRGGPAAHRRPRRRRRLRLGGEDRRPRRASTASCPAGWPCSTGNASGPVPPIDPLVLSRKGSLFLTRPSLVHYIADRASLEARAADVLGGRGLGPARGAHRPDVSPRGGGRGSPRPRGTADDGQGAARPVIAREEYAGGRCFEVVIGDLLSEPVDAIVNAANGHLAHGGGVAAAIARAGGSRARGGGRPHRGRARSRSTSARRW